MALNPNFTAVDVRVLRDTTLDACEAGTLGVASSLFNFFKTEVDTAVETHATGTAYIDFQFETDISQALVDDITPDSNELEIAVQALERNYVRRGFSIDGSQQTDTSVTWIIQWGSN